jgi:hypothetical protein
LTCDITQLKTRLVQERVKSDVEGVADVEVFALFTQIDRAQSHWEQRPAQGFENIAHGLAGRQLTTAHFTTDASVEGAPIITGSAQLTDDPVQLPMTGQAFGASL